MNSNLHLCHLNSILIIFLASLAGAVIIPLPNYYAYGQGLSNNDNSMVPELPPNFEMPSEFDSFPSTPPADFFSDLNFSDFEAPLTTTTDDDFDSPEIYFPDVKGTYINSDIGFQVDLPKDWKGKEIKFLNNMVFAAPQEINLDKLEEPGTLMIISGIDQKYVDMLKDLTKQLPTFEEEGGGSGLGGKGEEQGLLQGNNPMNMPTPYSNTESCNKFQTLPITINGISAEQLTAECVDEKGTNIKAKSYAFATQDNSIISMAFVSNSTNEYNQYLPLFDESVKTLKITNPGNIATSEIYKKYKELELQSKVKTMS
jgi:hypothetical protein